MKVSEHDGGIRATRLEPEGQHQAKDCLDRIAISAKNNADNLRKARIR